MRKLTALIPGAILLVFSCTKPNSFPPNSYPSPGDVPVAIAIDLSRPGLQIPERFTGLSFETQALYNGTWFDNTNTSFVNLVKGLGKGVLRVSGSSSDRLKWSEPADGPMIFYTDANRFFAFAGTTGWPVLFGLNLATSPQHLVEAEAKFLLGDHSQQVAAVEIGNEPDLYSLNGLRPASYSYEAFKNDWTVRWLGVSGAAPGLRVAGPSTSSNTWVTAFARDRHQFLSWLTEHYYKLGTGTDTVESIARLLDGNDNALARAGVLAAAAKPYQLPYRINECNSTASAKEGVSNTFASALWGLDFMFALASQGLNGVNFHTSDAPSTPIAFLSGDAKANPLYYGMLMFAKASDGQLMTVKSVPQSAVNLTSYAVQQADGTLQVTLINKDLSKEAFVSLSAINGSGKFDKASAIRLKAPSPGSVTGVSLGGSSVKADGTWSASQQETLAIGVNTTTVKVPAYSAVLVTLKGSGWITK